MLGAVAGVQSSSPVFLAEELIKIWLDALTVGQV